MIDLLSIIDNAQALEKRYQEDKSAFKKEFTSIYPQIKDTKFAEYWLARLNYSQAEISFGNSKELLILIAACLFSGFIAKIPDIFSVGEQFYYSRNIGFIFLPVLSFYFIWKNEVSIKKVVLIGISLAVALLYINLLPNHIQSDTLLLSCIHLPLFIWAVLGYSYLGKELKSPAKRLQFLRYNGDLIVMSTLMLISGGILSVLSIGLFAAIGIQIERFYVDYIVICGAAAVPVVATYITQSNPMMVDKVSPLIAKIFSPIVLITLAIYLVSIFVAGKNPYQDREFLIIFNFLLIGVMAIILFSISGTSKSDVNKVSIAILFALSLLTIIANSIALSAILFRIAEWGLSPNKSAVLGANVLMLINLTMVALQIFKCLTKKEDFSKVGNAISWFLPVYVIWIMIVTFIFPLLFHFS
ncbi:MAG: hypothetical protein ACOYOA_13775 [Saprospiraceae bacterium]